MELTRESIENAEWEYEDGYGDYFEVDSERFVAVDAVTFLLTEIDNTRQQLNLMIEDAHEYSVKVDAQLTEKDKEIERLREGLSSILQHAVETDALYNESAEALFGFAPRDGIVTALCREALKGSGS